MVVVSPSRNPSDCHAVEQRYAERRLIAWAAAKYGVRTFSVPVFRLLRYESDTIPNVEGRDDVVQWYLDVSCAILSGKWVCVKELSVCGMVLSPLLSLSTVRLARMRRYCTV